MEGGQNQEFGFPPAVAELLDGAYALLEGGGVRAFHCFKSWPDDDRLRWLSGGRPCSPGETRSAVFPPGERHDNAASAPRHPGVVPARRRPRIRPADPAAPGDPLQS